jgi:hypothetical protein
MNEELGILRIKKCVRHLPYRCAIGTNRRLFQGHRNVAGGFQEPLDLLAGNELLTKHFATGQMTAGDQSADGFCADIQDGGRFFNRID